MTTRKSAASLEDVRQLARVAAQAAAEKKGESIVILEVGSILAITDAFVIASASNQRLVRAIADEVEAKVKEAGGGGPIRIEGLDDARWVLLDYGDFVVHLFLDEVREYYDLERLWADAPIVEWDGDARKSAVSR
ncbi:MAG TPA: ribosome silencing factor [Acidimicrobiales bacterium]|nr:ribosome silencing factor [Acidimicrobiales bacterium]